MIDLEGIKINFPLYSSEDLTAYKIREFSAKDRSLEIIIDDKYLSFKDAVENIIASTELTVDHVEKVLSDKNAKGLLVEKRVRDPLYGREQKHIYIYYMGHGNRGRNRKEDKDGSEKKNLYGKYFSIVEDKGDSGTRGYMLIIAPKDYIEKLQYVEKVLIQRQNGSEERFRVTYAGSPWRIVGEGGRRSTHRTYPVIAVPFLRITFDKAYTHKRDDSAGVGVNLLVASFNIVKRLVGSIVIYSTVGEQRYQLPFIVYSPAANTRSGTFSPSNIYSNMGSVALYFKVNKSTLEALSNVFKQYIGEASVIVSEILSKREIGKFVNEEYVKTTSGKKSGLEEAYSRIVGGDLIIHLNNDGGDPRYRGKWGGVKQSCRNPGSIEIDPKTLLKTLVYYSPLELATSQSSKGPIEISIGENMRFSSEEREIRRSLNSRLRRFSRETILCVDNARKITGDIEGEEDPVPVCFTRVRSFEKELFSLLWTVARLRKTYQNTDINVIVTAAYIIMVVLEIAGELLARGYNGKEIRVNIRVDKLAEKLTLAYLELGFHGLLHMFRRAVAYQLNIHERELGEMLIVCSEKYEASLFIDGYLLRLRNCRARRLGENITVDGGSEENMLIETSISSESEGVGNNLFAFLVVYRSKSNSYSSMARIYSEKSNMKNLFEMFRNASREILFEPNGVSRCYDKWLVNAAKIRAGLKNIFKISINGINIGLDEFEKMVGEYVEGFSSIDNRLEKVKSMLYLPETEMRRLYVKVLEKAVGAVNVHPDKLRDLRSKVRNYYKIYSPAILDYYVPRCFDGCFGCVMSRECTVRNPLAKEWIVSKNAAVTILKLAGLLDESHDENTHAALL